MENQNLVAFLYILMRDKLPSGAVEEIMEKHVEPVQDMEITFTNPHLEAHARWLANRIMKKEE